MVTWSFSLNSFSASMLFTPLGIFIEDNYILFQPSFCLAKQAKLLLVFVRWGLFCHHPYRPFLHQLQFVLSYLDEEWTQLYLCVPNNAARMSCKSFWYVSLISGNDFPDSCWGLICFFLEAEMPHISSSEPFWCPWGSSLPVMWKPKYFMEVHLFSWKQIPSVFWPAQKVFG